LPVFSCTGRFRLRSCRLTYDRLFRLLIF